MGGQVVDNERALRMVAHPYAPGSGGCDPGRVRALIEGGCGAARPERGDQLRAGQPAGGSLTATDSHTVRFHEVERGTCDRIRNRRVNERTGEEAGPCDIVKGYDADGEYVLVEPKELDETAPGRSQALEIAGFVDLDEVGPIFFDRTYHLGPRGKGYEKVHSLLEQALARTGKAGIATFVMRQHEYLAAVKSEDGLLTLHPLHKTTPAKKRVRSTPKEDLGGLSEADLYKKAVAASVPGPLPHDPRRPRQGPAGGRRGGMSTKDGPPG